MDVAGEYTFDAPQDMVWEALRDPNVLGSILPGGEGIEEVGENKYEGILKIKVGPVQGKFKGKIAITDIVEPDSYTIDVDGKGAPGFVKGGGGLKLTAQGDQTHMSYSGKARVGGRIASVGQRLLDASSKSIINQSLNALNEYLKYQVAQKNAPPEPEPTLQETVATAVDGAANAVADAAESVGAATQSSPPPRQMPPAQPYKPPSQMEFAASVTNEIFEDLVPEPMRPVVISVVTTLVTLFVMRLFSRK